ncbi:MAG: hypothetical protein Q8N48_16450 [Thiobacillus sp.]|nr:hypothetical protein [Thiobacillus sp.]MDP2980407.1 hypothetical protein [Thiobacillus sp.]MDZ4159951.1 hypothetical protein [Anaerolineaceae bacterium]
MSSFINVLVFIGLLLSGAGMFFGIYFGMDSLVAWSTVSGWGFGVYSVVAFFVASILGCVRRSIAVLNRLMVFNFILSAVGFIVVIFL